MPLEWRRIRPCTEQKFKKMYQIQNMKVTVSHYSFICTGFIYCKLGKDQPTAFSFATFSGFQGEVLVQILDFPICSIHLNFSLSSKQCSKHLNFSLSSKQCSIHLNFSLSSKQCSIHLNFSLSSKQGEVNQLMVTFSPKSPSRLGPVSVIHFYHFSHVTIVRFITAGCWEIISNVAYNISDPSNDK